MSHCTRDLSCSSCPIWSALYLLWLYIPVYWSVLQLYRVMNMEVVITDTCNQRVSIVLPILRYTLRFYCFVLRACHRAVCRKGIGIRCLAEFGQNQEHVTCPLSHTLCSPLRDSVSPALLSVKWKWRVMARGLLNLKWLLSRPGGGGGLCIVPGLGAVSGLAPVQPLWLMLMHGCWGSRHGSPPHPSPPIQPKTVWQRDREKGFAAPCWARAC